MIRSLRALAFATVLVLPSAHAATITFDSLSIGSTFATYSEAGATFSAVGGGTFQVQNGPGGIVGLLEISSPRKVTRVDFGAAATSVSVELGDAGADADLAFLRAFSSGDVLLAEQTLLLDPFNAAMNVLAVLGADIAYVLLGSEGPSVNGSSVYIDNFTFDGGTTVVPVPAALPLMAFGLAALGAVARRRRGN